MINGEVSFWWHSREPGPATAPLDGDRQVDVCIVGAGCTGLWTAYYLKKAAPDLRVVVLEERFAGYGASGRNGGWLTNEITGGVGQYRRSHGPDAVDAFQRAMNDSVDEVVAVAAAEGIDADIHVGGEFTVARGRAQRDRLRAGFEASAARAGTDVQWLEPGAARERIAVAGTTAATWHPHCARLHPVKLVAGLARVVRELGVEIHEGTRVREIGPHQARTDHATVRADVVVRATEGFTTRLPGSRREWLPLNSSMIVTPPLGPETWAEIGWAAAETLGDSAHAYMYAQRTADGRIALGGRGVPYRYGSRFDLDGRTDGRTVLALRQILAEFFPVLRGIEPDHAWSGVLGVPRDWHATVGLDRRTGLAWAGGFVGTGVTATNLAGRTLRDLVLGEDSDLTALPWVDHRVRRWEIEPLRWLAVTGLYRTYRLADRLEARGARRTSVLAAVADRIAGR